MISEMRLNKSTSFKLLEEIACQCSAFDSNVLFIKGDREANAKDIVDLVTLSLHPNDKIAVIIEGPDEKDACEKIFQLLN